MIRKKREREREFFCLWAGGEGWGVMEEKEERIGLIWRDVCKI